jgi:hypothetical protein
LIPDGLTFLLPDPASVLECFQLTRQVNLPVELTINVGFAWLEPIFATPLDSLLPCAALHFARVRKGRKKFHVFIK